MEKTAMARVHGNDLQAIDGVIGTCFGGVNPVPRIVGVQCTQRLEFAALKVASKFQMDT